MSTIILYVTFMWVILELFVSGNKAFWEMVSTEPVILVIKLLTINAMLA